jgi:hypothetical protein
MAWAAKLVPAGIWVVDDPVGAEFLVDSNHHLVFCFWFVACSVPSC